jgi:Tol biopolymer transport system component
MAQPFDNRRFELTGVPAPVADDVGASYFSTSANGSLAYRRNRGPNGRLTWFNRKGDSLGSIGDLAGYREVSLSPDGLRVASSEYEGRRFLIGNLDIWLYEFARNNRTRATFHTANERMPTWSPDGSRIIFASDRAGVYDLYQEVANGAGNDELLLKSGENKFPLDWSRDGRFLLYASVDEKSRYGLWVLPLSHGPTASGTPVRYLASEFNYHQGRFSPDGQWIAYTSNQSGRDEVYVQPFPDSSIDRVKVSQAGGTQPRWRRDGKELFYISTVGSKVMAVDVTPQPRFRAGIPRSLFTAALLGAGNPAITINTHRYDVTADGQRFLLPAASAETVLRRSRLS